MFSSPLLTSPSAPHSPNPSSSSMPPPPALPSTRASDSFLSFWLSSVTSSDVNYRRMLASVLFSICLLQSPPRLYQTSPAPDSSSAASEGGLLPLTRVSHVYKPIHLGPVWKHSGFQKSLALSPHLASQLHEGAGVVQLAVVAPNPCSATQWVGSPGNQA